MDDQFDIIFLDEGHKALGTSSQQIYKGHQSRYVDHCFTATPDYHASRSLQSLLPSLIHRLDLKEAIELNMLSSVIPVAVPAPTTTAQEFSIGALGEYENKSLKQLIHNTARNRMVVSIAARLIQAGNTPIIACIPGETMTHPHLIADMLAEQYVDDEMAFRVRYGSAQLRARFQQPIVKDLCRT